MLSTQNCRLTQRLLERMHDSCLDLSKLSKDFYFFRQSFSFMFFALSDGAVVDLPVMLLLLMLSMALSVTPVVGYARERPFVVPTD